MAQKMQVIFILKLLHPVVPLRERALHAIRCAGLSYHNFWPNGCNLALNGFQKVQVIIMELQDPFQRSIIRRPLLTFDNDEVCTASTSL